MIFPGEDSHDVECQYRDEKCKAARSPIQTQRHQWTQYMPQLYFEDVEMQLKESKGECRYKTSAHQDDQSKVLSVRLSLSTSELNLKHRTNLESLP